MGALNWSLNSLKNMRTNGAKIMVTRFRRESMFIEENGLKMMTNEDMNRVVKGSADLEERIEQLEKQKEILKAACKKAGETIKTLTVQAEKAEEDLVKALAGDHRVAESDKIIMKKMEEIEQLKADLARVKEDHQYDNLVHQKELRDLRKK